ncbi:helix-turn-helix domain-containing protein [Flavobacterium chuncheonense]|uniref:Helix-turn-helix domain-containing protein n=1 Tax=Flavobacterium chuncheonense TaxID=2026653 RepID=A0ABW5YK10_9FLAO
MNLNPKQLFPEIDNFELLHHQMVTKKDLLNFGNALLNEIQSATQTQSIQTKQWLKSAEVRKLLNISPGTLQNLRINGTLSYTKIGGILYYNHSDIQKLLTGK